MKLSVVKFYIPIGSSHSILSVVPIITFINSESSTLLICLFFSILQSETFAQFIFDNQKNYRTSLSDTILCLGLSYFPLINFILFLLIALLQYNTSNTVFFDCILFVSKQSCLVLLLVCSTVII